MKQLIVNVANPLFAIGVLVALCLAFIAIVYWVWFRTPLTVHEEHARIPLNQSDHFKKEV